MTKLTVILFCVLDELDKKEETVPPPTDDSTHAPPTVPERETKPRQKSDSQSEVQKIFDKLKVSRLQTQDPVQVGLFLNVLYVVHALCVHTCMCMYMCMICTMVKVN